jgi:biopolymer transport protein ExbD
MPLKTSRAEDSTINLTPMIDVVFLLIIFFMVSSRFSELSEAEKDVPLNVPQVAHAAALTSAPRKQVVNIHDDGAITLNEQSVTVSELVEQLKEVVKQYDKTGVIVRGDADERFQRVAEVLAACHEAGIEDMGISVRSLQR